MKIIADTHIWYYLGQDENLFKKVKDEPIAPTFINIYELCKSENLIDRGDLVKHAIQKLFHFKTNVIYEPPFVYVAKLHKQYDFDVKKEIGDILQFASMLAKGQSIEENKKETFRIILKEKTQDLQNAADMFNAEAEKIRQRIIDRNSHKKEDTQQLTGGFINFCVEVVTNKQCNLEGFDLNQIELLVKTLDKYFKSVEMGHRKIKANDWFDFAILGYVQPGDKIWTQEKQWLNLIKEAGCENYLFKVNKCKWF